MTNLSITLSGEAFEALFPLRANHLNLLAPWSGRDGDGCLFETYGPELEFVCAQDIRCVWTLIQQEDGKAYIASGWHVVNRLGFFISETPVPVGVEISVQQSERPRHEKSEPVSAALQMREMLAKQHQIAFVFGVDDVQAIRPDLDHEQSWAVLQDCEATLTTEFGLSYAMIEIVAGILFPLSSKSRPSHSEDRP